MAEIARRAQRYGLPPITWPPGWPPNSLAAMRACVWAERVAGAEAAERFARTAFRAAFAQCADLSDMMVLTATAHRAGLPADGLQDGIADPEVKQALKDATDTAITAGVNGVPALITEAGAVLFGDDQLERAG